MYYARIISILTVYRELHYDLISVSICASECIPNPNTGQSKRKIPGWDITVSQTRDIALFLKKHLD